MKTYLTQEGHPVKTNCPQATWTEVSEIAYEAKVKEINDKTDADKKKQDDDMKIIQEQDKRIAAKLREIALKDLKEDDLRPLKITAVIKS
jgi:hypothetical protein